jgi:hypothetical protein
MFQISRRLLTLMASSLTRFLGLIKYKFINLLLLSPSLIWTVPKLPHSVAAFLLVKLDKDMLPCPRPTRLMDEFCKIQISHLHNTCYFYVYVKMTCACVFKFTHVVQLKCFVGQAKESYTPRVRDTKTHHLCPQCWMLQISRWSPTSTTSSLTNNLHFYYYSCINLLRLSPISLIWPLSHSTHTYASTGDCN